MFKRFGLSVLLSACPLLAHAAGVDPYEEFAQHLRAAQEVAPLTSAEFGDSISLYNAATEFNIVDIDVPGNNALPVRLGRRFEVADWRGQGTNNGTVAAHIGGFGEWDMDVPYLEGVFALSTGWKVKTPNGFDRCSTPAVPDTNWPAVGLDFGPPDLIWDGYHMHTPGSGSQELLVNTTNQLPNVTDGKSYPWVTKNYTRVTCEKSTTTKNGYPGEGFIAVSADGVKTYFDWVVVRNYPDIFTTITYFPEDLGGGPIRHYAQRSKIFMLATRMEDRFGNWVNYAYTTNTTTGDALLSSITSSDGRSITPTYTNGVITSASSSIGNWTYSYVTDTNSAYFNSLSLHAVTRPDGSQWTYNASGTLKSSKEPPDDSHPPPFTHCQINNTPNTGSFTYSVGAPFGAVATYQFLYDRHYRSYVPLSCRDGDPHHLYPEVFDFVDNYGITSKTITGPGLTPKTWLYSELSYEAYYTPSVPGPINTANQTYVPAADCPLCAVSKTVTVTGPNEITKYTFGEQYARNEGRLLGTEIDALNGTPLMVPATPLWPIAKSRACHFPPTSVPTWRRTIRIR